MKDTTLRKLGGTCSVLVGVCFLALFALPPVTPVEQQADPYTCHCAAKYLTSVAHNSTAQVAGLGLLALASAFSIAVVLAVYETVRAANDGWARWSGALAIIGFAVNMIDPLRRIALNQALAVAYVHGDAVTKAALTTPSAFLGLDPQAWLKFGAVGLWLLVVNLLALRGGTWPRLLAIVGLGLALALAFWLVVAGEVLQLQARSLFALPAVIASAILLPVWYIWLGLRLRRAG